MSASAELLVSLRFKQLVTHLSSVRTQDNASLAEDPLDCGSQRRVTQRSQCWYEQFMQYSSVVLPEGETVIVTVSRFHTFASTACTMHASCQQHKFA